jgi:hypothetical protein
MLRRIYPPPTIPGRQQHKCADLYLAPQQSFNITFAEIA